MLDAPNEAHFRFEHGRLHRTLYSCTQCTNARRMVGSLRSRASRAGVWCVNETVYRDSTSHSTHKRVS